MVGRLMKHIGKCSNKKTFCGRVRIKNYDQSYAKEPRESSLKEKSPVTLYCICCFVVYDEKTCHRLFSRGRKVTKDNCTSFNHFMKKSHKRTFKIGEKICDKCDAIYWRRYKAEKGAENKKLDLEIEKNKNTVRRI
jgi:hypothetical protein